MPTAGPPAPTPREEEHDLTTPEEIASRQRRRRLLRRGGVLLILLVIGGLAGRPAVRAVKGWQARRAAAEAMRLLEAGQIEPAVGKVQDALSLRGNDPVVIQTAATFLTRVGHGREAVGFWKEAEKGRPLTREEQRLYAGALLQAGDPAAATSHLRAAWPEGTEGTPADWILGMQVAVRGRDAGTAAKLARQLIESKAPDIIERQRFDAAQLLLSINDSASRETGQATLQALADGGKSVESLEALMFLTRQLAQSIGQRRARQQEIPEADATALLKLTARVEAHPKAQTPQKLLALQARWVAQPADRAALIKEGIDRYGRSSAEDLAELGSWLYAQGEYQRVLDVLTPERAVGSRALYLEYLDALGATGRWDEIRQSIEGQRFTLDPLVSEMYLARCAKQLGHPDGAATHWAAALRAAGTNPDKLLSLGRYAQTDGDAATAEAAFRAAIKANPENRPAHEALLGLLQTQGHTRELLAAARAMLAVFPQDASVRNDDAYLAALLGENLTADRDTARELVRLAPNSLPHRVTLALAELRLGHDLTALETLQTAPDAAYAGQSRFLAVRAAVYWRTGYQKEALEMVANLPRGVLLPEERQLIVEIKG